MSQASDKVMIVEGLTDKKKVHKVMTDNITVICTNGTLGVEKFDEFLYRYDLDHKDVYILVDEDEPGIKLRKQLSCELPHAKHLYISSDYKEVATTPENELAIELLSNNISVNPLFLI